MVTVGTVVERPKPAAGRWVPPGHPASVGDHAIPGGLFYLGRHLRAATGGVEPALVNPDLPVAASGIPVPTSGIPVPASGFRSAVPETGPELAYHLLSPATRQAYLSWLSGGRRADVPAGLVRLFCFGLERRVLVDADHDPAVRRELPTIVAEVRRLRVRFGDGQPALGDTLERLLDLLGMLAAPRATGGGRYGGAPAAPGWESEPGRATPMGVRLALAHFAATSARVPLPWARAWARHHPTLSPRGAQVHCPTEFDRLFALRYRDQHGPGLVPPHDVPGLRLRYQPASPGLATTLVCREDLPDVLAEPRGTRALGALLDDVAAALDPYRRWLARFPRGRGSLAAATMLPPELVDADHGQLGALRVWAERRLDGRPWAVVDAGDFWAFWSTAAPDRMARDEAAALLSTLALLDLGVEPDVRFGGAALSRGPAVLFRLGRPAADRPSARFPAAAAIARCAVAVASAAGPVDPSGPRGSAVLAATGDLAAALRLAPGEDLRLAARLGWLLTTRVDVDRLSRQITTVPAAEREIAGHYLVSVALAADPAVGPATVAVVTRVYRILGLEPDLVFHRLHERAVRGGGPSAPAFPRPLPIDPVRGRTAIVDQPAMSGPDDPVIVRTAEVTPSGYALPWAGAAAPATPLRGGAPSVGPTDGIALDPASIHRTMIESDAATAMLNEVFDADPEPASSVEPATTGQIAGLDVAHSALLRALSGQSSWTRTEFASLAMEHGVLPDGALDLLNDVAIDAVGAPVINDDDTLALDNDVLLELLA